VQLDFGFRESHFDDHDFLGRPSRPLRTTNTLQTDFKRNLGVDVARRTC
jgi:hypothetical protein